AGKSKRIIRPTDLKVQPSETPCIEGGRFGATARGVGVAVGGVGGLWGFGVGGPSPAGGRKGGKPPSPKPAKPNGN
ncbi:hypothetical protein ABTH30_22555, partial [Acinetobacter baumannii]